jgi:hypothetical protein
MVGIEGCGLKIFADPFAYVKRVDLILIALKGRPGCDPANAFFIQTSTTASLLNQVAARAMVIGAGKQCFSHLLPCVSRIFRLVHFPAICHDAKHENLSHPGDECERC